MAAKLSSHELALHQQALACAQRFLSGELDLLNVLLNIDRHRLYERFHEAGLTPYCINILGLSEQVAACFVRVTRKCQDVPALKAALDAKRITLYKAKAIASVATRENLETWIQRAESLSKHALEQEVATAMGRDYRKLELRLTRDEFDNLHRARDLVSRRRSRDVSWEEAICESNEVFLEKFDPQRKAERNLNKKGRHCSQEQSPTRGVRIPAKERHQVEKRDQGRCQAMLPNGKLCQNRRWLHFHHVIPRSEGGQNKAENLVTLCSAHHGQIHRHPH